MPNCFRCSIVETAIIQVSSGSTRSFVGSKKQIGQVPVRNLPDLRLLFWVSLPAACSVVFVVFPFGVFKLRHHLQRIFGSSGQNEFVFFVLEIAEIAEVLSGGVDVKPQLEVRNKKCFLS